VFETHHLLTGLLFHIQWRYATKDHRLVDKDLPENTIRRGKEIPSLYRYYPVWELSWLPRISPMEWLYTSVSPSSSGSGSQKSSSKEDHCYDRKHSYGKQDEVLL